MTDSVSTRADGSRRRRLQRRLKRARGRTGRVFDTDLVLLHAPSVWDFREEVILQGPLADVIPSTTEFEMYPIGLTSIAAYLEANNYNTRLVNIAYRMLRNPNFDVEAKIASLHAPVFGIDLHWLPHANGALGIAELVKKIHPEAKVLLGGPLRLRRFGGIGGALPIVMTPENLAVVRQKPVRYHRRRAKLMCELHGCLRSSRVSGQRSSAGTAR